MTRPPRDEDARSETAGPADGGADRGLLGALRSLLFVVLLAVVAVGGVLYGPALADDLAVYVDPVEVEEPPPAGDRTPATLDPDDPGNSSFEGRYTTFTSQDVEDFVHHEINDRRAERGLARLEWDGTVASVSRAHSADMHERSYFAHENPDGAGPYDRFQDVAGYCRAYGENLAKTAADGRVREPDSGDVVRYATPEELAVGLVDQWMQSPPHRENVLEEDITYSWDRAGVGVYLDEEGEVYATQNFCHEV